uniref:Uncharacterized protein n=1 Tax=Timema cristinae TaxID=61476 RepID=A0A7R9CFZ9_TIMCR|nr:unnamed protein product [Timema cristinae]
MSLETHAKLQKFDLRRGGDSDATIIAVFSTMSRVSLVAVSSTRGGYNIVQKEGEGLVPYCATGLCALADKLASPQPNPRSFILPPARELEYPGKEVIQDRPTSELHVTWKEQPKTQAACPGLKEAPSDRTPGATLAPHAHIHTPSFRDESVTASSRMMDHPHYQASSHFSSYGKSPASFRRGSISQLANKGWFNSLLRKIEEGVALTDSWNAALKAMLKISMS